MDYIVKVGLDYHTPEGGVAQEFTWYDAGAAVSTAGLAVSLGPNDDTVQICPAGDPDLIGAIYPVAAGIASGGQILVVTRGVAWALVEDSTTVVADRWVYMSPTVDGRINATLSAPPGPSIIADLEQHFNEFGHARRDVASGSNVLIPVQIHLN
jgi:hypothetical protein